MDDKHFNTITGTELLLKGVYIGAIVLFITFYIYVLDAACQLLY